MKIVVDETNRIFAISQIAEPEVNGIKIANNVHLMGNTFNIHDVKFVPPEVCAQNYFYLNGTFVKDPNKVSPRQIEEVEKTLESLYQEIMGKDITEMSLDELKVYKRSINNNILSDYLKSHPLLWTNGKYYGVSKDDQTELEGNFLGYELSVKAGFTDILEWHEVGGECEPWNYEELVSLMISIKRYVMPYVKLCQRYKVMIINSTTREECLNIKLEYSEAALQLITDEVII